MRLRLARDGEGGRNAGRYVLCVGCGPGVDHRQHLAGGDPVADLFFQDSADCQGR